MVRSTISYNAALVLQALAQGVGYGFEVMRRAQLPSGTVYPLLRRLEDGGLVRSRWESEAKAHSEGRPPRRYYEISAAGSRSLAAAKGRFAAHRALFDEGLPNSGGRG